MTSLNDCFASLDKRLLVSDALERFSNGISAVGGLEKVSLNDAVDRILFADLKSGVTIPPRNNSAVDGYAVYFNDLSPETETILPISGRIAAGHPLKRLAKRGEAIKIFTGAQLPLGENDSGPDTIFMLEDVGHKDDCIVIPMGQKKGANLRLAGEDVKKGDTVLRAGRRLRPQDVGMAAALGLSQIPVRERLKVAVFSTGDEIKEPGDIGQNESIFDINRYTLQSLLQKLGCKTSDIGIFPDDIEVLRQGISDASKQHDLLITSGGVSKGEEDYVRTAVSSLGQLHAWNLLIKPGRPIALGHILESGREVPIIGLPGNPVAVLVTFLLIARPIILLLSGSTQITPNSFPVVSGFAFSKKPGRREWLRAILRRDENNLLQAVKYPDDGSGILSSMVASDGLIELGEEVTEVCVGEMVDFLPFGEVF